MAKIPAELSKMLAEGRLTYRGWEDDVEAIKEQVAGGSVSPSRDNGLGLSFASMRSGGGVNIATMVRRQAVWEGDRAAVPGLKRLDALLNSSTPPCYPGLEADVELAEKNAVEHPRIFESFFEKIVRRQQIRECTALLSNSVHAQSQTTAPHHSFPCIHHADDGTLVPDGIAQLDALVQGGTLTYKDWKRDVDYARAARE